MRINLGTVRSRFSGFKAIADIAAQLKGTVQESIILDFSSCQFFDANMAAPLFAVVSRLRAAGNNVDVENIAKKTCATLQRNGFLSHFNLAGMRDFYQTTLPFTIFAKTEGIQFHQYVTRHTQGKGIPAMSPELTKHFQQNLLEIFLNAAFHSQSESGIFVCGQSYPKQQRLDFTIADAGIGIPENVRSYTGQYLTACDAIAWAMQEGNTTKTGNEPGGLGLKLIKDFILKNKGTIHIVSQSGYYQFKEHTDSFQEMECEFPGTCINIEINTADTSSYCLRSELTSADLF